MQALIVLAHPEPRSFNAALRDVSREVLAGAGWTVVESDLYAMNFDPVVNRSDFTTVQNPDYLNVSLEQRHALQHHGLAADVGGELDKLLAADLLLLHFPLWWFGLPAILKGWIDRVFVSGGVYGRTAMYETGKLRGKRAMLCLTTGAPEQAFGPDSLNGELLDLLAPIHRGVLGLTGMTVLPPFAAFATPYAGQEGRDSMLRAWRAHLAALDRLEPLAMPRLDMFPNPFGGRDRPRAR